MLETKNSGVKPLLHSTGLNTYGINYAVGYGARTGLRLQMMRDEVVYDELASESRDA
jgi:hypothetical protein